MNHFVHTGHLHIDGLKMSKSLKNFITIRASLEMYTARQIRFLFLLHQWSDPMDLTPVQEGERVVGFKQMEQAAAIEKVFAEFFHRAKGAMRDCPGGTASTPNTRGAPTSEPSPPRSTSARKNVHAAMLDNINTPGVVKALKAAGAANVYLGAAPRATSATFSWTPPRGTSRRSSGASASSGARPRTASASGSSRSSAAARAKGATRRGRRRWRPRSTSSRRFGTDSRVGEIRRKLGRHLGGVRPVAGRGASRDRGEAGRAGAEGGALWKLEGVEALRRERLRGGGGAGEAGDGAEGEEGGGGAKTRGEVFLSHARARGRARTRCSRRARTRGCSRSSTRRACRRILREGEELPKAQRKKFSKLGAAQKGRQAWRLRGDAGDAVEKMAV